VRVDTTRFGELDIPEEAILTFPEGILGFPELHQCCLLPYRRGSALRWLQSLTDPGLAFLVTEPHLFFPEYEVELPEKDAAGLALHRADEAVVLTLITISHERGTTGLAYAAAQWVWRRSLGAVQRMRRPSFEASAQLTANLVAPIVINSRSRQARQVILDDERYHVRHLIGILGRTDSGVEVVVGSKML